MANLLVTDIETIPNDAEKALQPFLDSVKGDKRMSAFNQRDDADKKKGVAIEKAALSPVSARILSIGILEVRNFDPLTCVGEEVPHFFSLFDMNEGEMLTEFDNLLGTVVHQSLVTFNGRSFDFPFMMFRAGILGIPGKFHMLPTGPYNGRDNHIDMFVHLNSISGLDKLYQYWNWIGLGKWVKALNLPFPKQDIGANLIEYFNKGDKQTVETYNMEDVFNTYALLKRFSSNFDFTVRPSRSSGGF